MKNIIPNLQIVLKRLNRDKKSYLWFFRRKNRKSFKNPISEKKKSFAQTLADAIRTFRCTFHRDHQFGTGGIPHAAEKFLASCASHLICTPLQIR